MLIMDEWESFPSKVMTMMVMIALANIRKGLARDIQSSLLESPTVRSWEVYKIEMEMLTMTGHQPAEENWQDYHNMVTKQQVKQRTFQREIDKTKLRYYLMGRDIG